MGHRSCCLFESAAHNVTFLGGPLRAMFRRCEPSRVAGEMVVVNVGSGWLQVDVEVVFPYLGPSSLFSVPFLLV